MVELVSLTIGVLVIVSSAVLIIFLLVHVIIAIRIVGKVEVKSDRDSPGTSTSTAASEESRFQLSSLGRLFLWFTATSILLCEGVDLLFYAVLIGPSVLLKWPISGADGHAAIARLMATTQIVSLFHVTTNAATSVVEILSLNRGQYEIIRSSLCFAWIFAASYVFFIQELIAPLQFDLDKCSLLVERKQSFSNTYYAYTIGGLFAMCFFSSLLLIRSRLKELANPHIPEHPIHSTIYNRQKRVLQLVYSQLTFLQLVFKSFYYSILVANQLTNGIHLPLASIQTILHILTNAMCILCYIRGLRMGYTFLKATPFEDNTLMMVPPPLTKKASVPNRIGFRGFSSSNSMGLQHESFQHMNDVTQRVAAVNKAVRKFKKHHREHRNQHPLPPVRTNRVATSEM